jgi:hypothetical protein
MSTTLWLTVALVGAPAATLMTARLRALGPPRFNAGVELLNLVSLALLPPVALVCIANNLACRLAAQRYCASERPQPATLPLQCNSACTLWRRC